MRQFPMVFVLVCTCLASAYGVSWYVDPQAPGAGNGQNWTNAWTSLTNISWKAISPGDTLFLSGGPNGRHYHHVLQISKSGTSQSPIVIRVGQENSHNGPVILQGINLGPHDWISINGALNDSFPAPTNILGLRTITNNIGILCDSTNGSAIYMTSPVGVRLLWVGVLNARRGSERLAHGLRANMVRRGPTDHNEIKYCWFQNTDDDGIQWIGNDAATHFAHQEVSFSIIEWVGDDGIEANHGFSVHDCLIGPSRFVNGHPDGIQSQGSYWKIYNNEFQDFFNSWIRAQAVETNHHSVWIYNNVFLSGKRGEPKAFLYNTGIEVVQYAAWLGEVERMVWSDIVIANNTFFNANGVGGAINWAKRDERTSAAFVHNVLVTNSIVANNLFVDCARGASAAWQEMKASPPWGTRVHYATPDSLVWDYNTLSGKAKAGTQIGYGGTLFPRGEAMASATPWKNNNSRTVTFAGPERWDLRLSADDRTARGTGTNLAHLFTDDLLHQPRGLNGRWSRGAFEAPASP